MLRWATQWATQAAERDDAHVLALACRYAAYDDVAVSSDRLDLQGGDRNDDDFRWTFIRESHVTRCQACKVL
jgi:hypothetical protein